METIVLKTTNANVFERVAGKMWRWWYNAKAKRRAERQAQAAEVYIVKRRVL
jgi:hypothetical protein